MRVVLPTLVGKVQISVMPERIRQELFKMINYYCKTRITAMQCQQRVICLSDLGFFGCYKNLIVKKGIIMTSTLIETTMVFLHVDKWIFGLCLKCKVSKFFLVLIPYEFENYIIRASVR